MQWGPSYWALAMQLLRATWALFWIVSVPNWAQLIQELTPEWRCCTYTVRATDHNSAPNVSEVNDTVFPASVLQKSIQLHYNRTEGLGKDIAVKPIQKSTFYHFFWTDLPCSCHLSEETTTKVCISVWKNRQRSPTPTCQILYYFWEVFSDIWNLAFWFLVRISYSVQHLFICASPHDPSVISFSSFVHKSPLAACIDSCSSCSPELCGITFMTLIIAILFCKVEIPFIIYVFTYQSNHLFLFSSFLIQTLPRMKFLPWSKEMEILCDFDWTSVHFWTLMNWWLQELIQLQLNSLGDWIQLLNSG